jgi:AcrR family transcriptional regulator
MDNVWLRPHKAGREAPTLSRERIVAGAVALLDEEGADRLTMRRLAERLDTGSTTLYWHVKTKDDVLDLALDSIFGEFPPPPATASWRADAAALVTAWRAVVLRHPWSAALLNRPMLGPNVLARTEFLHATLAGAGFTGTALPAAAYALANHVIGACVMQASGGDEAAGRAAADAHLRARADLYPTLAAHGALVGHDWTEMFRRGLDHLLDGLETALVHSLAERGPEAYDPPNC